VIAAATEEDYRFVTQPGHTEQVGRLAGHWGNDTFAAPTPRAPVVMAAACHDAGWHDHDLAPYLVDGERAGVLDTRGVDRLLRPRHGAAAERDPYAGLLCAMHGAGVRKRRYGTRADLPDSAERFAAFVDHLPESERYWDHTDEVNRAASRALHGGRSRVRPTAACSGTTGSCRRGTGSRCPAVPLSTASQRRADRFRSRPATRTRSCRPGRQRERSDRLPGGRSGSYRTRSTSRW
jgi:hypothetical protein